MLGVLRESTHEETPSWHSRASAEARGRTALDPSPPQLRPDHGGRGAEPARAGEQVREGLRRVAPWRWRWRWRWRLSACLVFDLIHASRCRSTACAADLV
jgi:hypothetical protein